MKTPYDSALRLYRREMDEMRVSISVQVDQLAHVEQRREALGAAMRREAELAAADWAFSSNAYLTRMSAQRESLARDRAMIDARLNNLRRRATETYGSLRAIEGADHRYRDESDRATARAEQADIDDFSAAGFTRALNARRRAGARSHGETQ